MSYDASLYVLYFCRYGLKVPIGVKTANMKLTHWVHILISIFFIELLKARSPVSTAIVGGFFPRVTRFEISVVDQINLLKS